ncbi:MAG: hypothetical protein QGG40_09810 [Myxococcota bacterium]|jgi:hypothetical protein|nr:hypothetical protein [Myxococcota bacterium]
MNKSPENLFDIRIVERNIAAGLVTREAYDEWLSSLKDDSSELEETESQMVYSYAAQVADDAGTEGASK